MNHSSSPSSSSSFSKLTNPTPFLVNNIGNQVTVKLKWGISYTGVLKSIDPFMNLTLTDPVEYSNNKKKGDIKGFLIIRCNNVLYVAEGIKIPPLDDEQDDAEEE